MVELFSLLILVFPFIFVGALARELAEQTNDNSRGWRFFWGAAAALALNMNYGFIRSAIAEADEKWTAASFGLAMIIPRSVVIVLVCWAVQARNVRRSKTVTQSDNYRQ